MAQLPIYSPQEEQRLMVELWSPDIADDPLAFVLFAFPWGKKGTPLEIFNGPRKWQRQVLADLRDSIASNRAQGSDPNTAIYNALQDATSSGRGIGKSALVSWLVIWMLTTRIGSTVTVSANTENQLRSVTWGELSKWSAMCINSHWWEISATKLLPAKWLSDIVESDMKKGTRYWGAEGRLWSEENPDGFAGTHNMDGMMVIFDEASGIPDSIWGVAKGFFTENIPDRYWFAFSNPRRNNGYFFECFNSKRDFWRSRKIDARTVEDTDKKIYQEIIDEHGEDSYNARVEIYGDFPSVGDNQLIASEVVDGAIARERYNDEFAPTIIGVDVARFGSDKTVIAVRHGRDLVKVRKYSGIDTMSVVGKVIEAIEEFDPDLTVIDEGGLGAGVLDRLLEQRYKVRGVNFGSKADSSTYVNKRSEMWGLLKEWLKTASIGSDTDNRLQDNRYMKSDLTGPEYKINSNGAIALESKDAMKKRGIASPDAADALAITFAYPVAGKTGSKRSLKNKSMSSSSNRVRMFGNSARAASAWMN